MKIESIHDEAFRSYGEVLIGYDFSALGQKMEELTEKPKEGTIYVPSDSRLESLAVSGMFSTNTYGGMPIQVGFCNGWNKKLNCLEYHRGCEVNIPWDDIILLLARREEMVDGKLDTSRVRAFLVKRGEAVVLYETTLHYAPCAVRGSDGFRVTVVLPRGTNGRKPALREVNDEDRRLWGSNKWLLAHQDSPEARQGAYVGLVGKNIEVE